MPIITRRTAISAAVGLGAAGVLPANPAIAAHRPPQIAIVAKLRIPWFDNVEIGIKRAAKDLGVDAWMIAPTSDDPALQVRAIEDLIAKKVDVIGVIPNDGKALVPVLGEAQKAGIFVVTQESPDQQNADWDIELIQNKEFGEVHLEALAELMGGQGKYVVYVGGLTVLLHNEWADYAVALQKKKYPKMQQIGHRYGVSNSVEDSYKTAVDLMTAHPDLRGFLIFGANGPIGAGQAVADRGMIGKVFVVGPFIPSQGKKLMQEGAISRGYLWSPITAGYAMVQLGNLLVKGTKPTDGMTISGIGKVSVDAATHTIRANKMIDINPKTIDKWAKLI